MIKKKKEFGSATKDLCFSDQKEGFMVKTTLKGAKITALEETKIVLPTKRKEKTLDFWRGLGREGKGLQLTARAIFLMPVRGREGVIIMRRDS